MALLKAGGIGRTLVRLLLWTVVGTVLGFVIGPDSVGEDWLARYPLISDLTNLLEAPAVVPFGLWMLVDLGPHGEEGLAVLRDFAIGMWPVYALLLGLLVEWRLRRQKATEAYEQPVVGKAPFKRAGLFIKRHLLLSVTSALVAGVGGYCIAQEVTLARDADFFLHRIDRQAVVEACRDVAVSPSKYSLSQGEVAGNDPRLPKAIRDLNASAVTAYPGGVDICKLPPCRNALLSLCRSKSDPTSFELTYVQGQRCLYRETLSLTTEASEPTSVTAHQ